MYNGTCFYGTVTIKGDNTSTLLGTVTGMDLKGIIRTVISSSSNNRSGTDGESIKELPTRLTPGTEESSFILQMLLPKGRPWCSLLPLVPP